MSPILGVTFSGDFKQYGEKMNKKQIISEPMELCFCWETHKIPYKTEFKTICSVISGISFTGEG